MKIEMVQIDKLKFAEYNPRMISDTQFEKLRLSIRTFGFVEPVVVNMFAGREWIIVGGHMRVRAGKAEGIKDVPCVFVNLSPAKEKTLNLALNRIHGEWDEQKLIEVMHDINVADDGDVKLTGFEDEEISMIIEDQNFAPGGKDQQSKLDRKSEAECPKCGHKFIP